MTVKIRKMYFLPPFLLLIYEFLVKLKMYACSCVQLYFYHERQHQVVQVMQQGRSHRQEQKPYQSGLVEFILYTILAHIM